MKNFSFQNPTKLIFGEGTISQITEEIPQDNKVLLIFGGGSAKQNGVNIQVREALNEYNVIEFWGIEPNPSIDKIREAVILAKNENIDYIVAVGGGSVIDASKLISVSYYTNDDPWDIVKSNRFPGNYLPMGSILTIPATGSEMNNRSVISNPSTKEKFRFFSPFPKFAILDPTLAFSLPDYQLACGLADTFVHVIEQYLTKKGESLVMDRWAEGILNTIIEISPILLNNKRDYDAMSQFMLSATMALNGFTSLGVTQDWSTHQIGHELTALSGITHGHSLTILLPGTLQLTRNDKREKLLQYGKMVWGINKEDPEESIDLTIKATEDFFRSLGLKTKLSENNIGESVIKEIVKRFKERGTKLGENQNIEYPQIERILEFVK